MKEAVIDSVDYKGCTIDVIEGDITDQPVDAIINPANEHLGNEGGAARAIKDSAGSVLVNECNDYIHANTKLETGEAMVTNAGKLPCKYVIHTVGPKCEEDQEDYSEESDLLAKCVKNSLK